MAHIATAALLLFIGSQGICAAEVTDTSGSTAGTAARLTTLAHTAKLALLCRRWPSPVDHFVVEAMLKDHALSAIAIRTDRALANAAIEDGVAWALVDFKASPLAACQTLEPNAVQLAANVIASRVTPHGMERQTYGMH